MYGLGLFKGLSITLKNMVLIHRTNTVQYPDKKASIFESIKNINSRSKVIENLYKQIITAVKKLTKLQAYNL